MIFVLKKLVKIELFFLFLQIFAMMKWSSYLDTWIWISVSQIIEFLLCRVKISYRTRAIITRSWSETALDYKPRILDPKIEELPCLVHK